MPAFTLPNLSGLDLSKFDLSKVKFPKFDLPKVDMSNFDMSNFDLSKVTLPTFDVPGVDLPKVDVDRLSELARDAVYVGVGVVALTVQKVTEAGREIQTEFTTRARQLAEAIA